MNTVTIDNLTHEIPAWQQEGLPAKPMQLIQNQVIWIPVDDLIRDDAGKIILAQRDTWITEAISEHLGKTIESVNFLPPTPPGGMMISPDSLLDTIAFRFAGEGRVSLPERRAIAAMAWTSDRFNFSCKRQPAYLIPEIFNSVANNNPDRFVGIPWKALSEEKAFQLAIFIEHRFDTDAQVIKRDGGYYVSATACDDLETNLHELEYMLGALEDFDLVPSVNWQNFSAPDEQDLDIEVLSSRIVNQVRHQEHITSQLDAILAALPGTTPNKAAGDSVKPSKDAHHLSAKPSRKARASK